MMEKKNIFLIVYILFAMIFLLVFSINYKKVYRSIENYEYKQYEFRMENQFQEFKDPSLETNKKFNLIINLYLFISFVIFLECYEKNKTSIKILILIVLLINILYIRFIYSKVQMELLENYIVNYLVCFSFTFFLFYEVIYRCSNKLLKKEYKIELAKINLVKDYVCWLLTLLNLILAVGGSIILKHFIF